MQLMTTADTLSLAYTRSTAGDPVSPWATQVMAPVAAGFSCLALDQPMLAAAQFDTALEVDDLPAAAQASIHSYFATSLLYLGRADLATQEYNLSNEMMPNAMAYTGLGNVALANRDWAAAEEAYGRAVAVDPYDPRPYCGLSIIASREYEVARAISSCQQAIALDATNAAPYAFLGMAYELQGDIETAQRAYQSSAYYAGPQAGLYVASLERAESIVRNPPTPIPTATPRPIPTATPVPTSAIYTVKANDSLSVIAEEFGVSVDTLREINGLRTVEEMLYIGQELLIPAKP
jgi:tetratricopeptide (TPR) repeat protein